MTPTGSWPTMRPLATGYSPRQMWESVPQIVVVVTFTTASVGPGTGLGTSSMWMSRTSWKTAARMVSGISDSPSLAVGLDRPCLEVTITAAPARSPSSAARNSIPPGAAPRPG